MKYHSIILLAINAKNDSDPQALLLFILIAYYHFPFLVIIFPNHLFIKIIFYILIFFVAILFALNLNIPKNLI